MSKILRCELRLLLINTQTCINFTTDAVKPVCIIYLTKLIHTERTNFLNYWWKHYFSLQYLLNQIPLILKKKNQNQKTLLSVYRLSNCTEVTRTSLSAPSRTAFMNPDLPGCCLFSVKVVLVHDVVARKLNCCHCHCHHSG